MDLTRRPVGPKHTFWLTVPNLGQFAAKRSDVNSLLATLTQPPLTRIYRSCGSLSTILLLDIGKPITPREQGALK
jgi:hypothetical protein